MVWTSGRKVDFGRPHGPRTLTVPEGDSPMNHMDGVSWRKWKDYGAERSLPTEKGALSARPN